MRLLRVLLLLLLCVLLPAAGGLAPAAAQGKRAAPSASRVEAERAAVDLKQGMTPDEVQKLLGKPWRTALTTNALAASAPSQGTLRWTYVWTGEASSSSSPPRSLHVEFNAKAAEQWSVSGWSWSVY
jgi:hypothetical protein